MTRWIERWRTTHNRAMHIHMRTLPVGERFKFWLFGGHRTVTKDGRFVMGYGSPPLWRRLRARINNRI